MTPSPESKTCPACGNAIPADSPGGWCPACLMDKLLGEGVQVDPSSADTVIHPTTPSSSVRVAPHERASDRIDRYKLLQEIGTGGFGSVWMAEQEEPVRRRVALKIIKLGMDTKNVIARFEAERQALAMMDHPNIAKVFDAGATASGRPYFVMELVRGIPITQYCDENNLPAPQRLALFIAVCHAIQHAHQKGIIHRDIKPSNILVTLHDGVPVPKVIDFGIAKATEARLTDRTLFTELHAFVGTPAYMSPEQAEMSGLDIDTRADIYSLGVLLYELLSGRLPFDPKELLKAGLDEIRRTIREVEPPRPSTRLGTMTAVERTAIAKQRGLDPAQLSSLLRGDLDWIVMKTLEKDRTRRYETANGLALDLQRYLDNEAVLARPPSTAYLIGKLIRRHKTAFAAAGTVALALLAGVTVSTWQAVRATRAERAADGERGKAVTERDRALQAEQEAESQRQLADTARKEAEYNLYVGSMNLAQKSWEEGNIGILRAILEETRSSPHRGFEWYYWLRQTHLEFLTLRGHTDNVTSVAYSSDGWRIVTGSYDNTAKVWDAETGRELLSLRAGGWVTSAAFSPDGRKIVTGIRNKTAQVWDAKTGINLLTLKGHEKEIESVAFSPDARRIVTGSRDNTARVWDADTGAELLTLKEHSGVIGSVAFSPNGRRITTGNWGSSGTVWDAETGREVLAIKGFVNSVAFSPDSRLIVTGNVDKISKLWDAETGRELLTLKGHADSVTSASFSPDGRQIVTGSDDKTAKVWDAATGGELLTLKGHEKAIESVVFSPNGRRIVTGSRDGTAKIWDVETGGDSLTLCGHKWVVTSVFVSPNGRQIVTGSDDETAKVWDAVTGGELITLKGHEGEIQSAAFSSDSRRIATGSWDSSAKVWDVQTGRELRTLKGHLTRYGNTRILSIAFSPDGRRLVTGSNDMTAKVWDLETGRERLTLTGHRNEVTSIAFSPDGSRIVTSGGEGIARIWDAETGRPLRVLKGHVIWVNSVAFSPDGRRVATGSWDTTAKVWNADTGEETITLHGHNKQLNSISFSPDGKRILTGSTDNTAKLWDAGTGHELLTLRGHTGSVNSVVFAPDGQRIVTGSRDWTAKVWRAASPEQVERWHKEEETYEQQRPGVALKRFETLIGKKDYPAAYQLAGEVSDIHTDNASLHNSFAWIIATDEKIEPRDLALAEKLATRATEADKGKSPDFIDTLARVLFMRGRKEEAIKLQEQAVTVAEDKRKPSFQKTLDSYRQGILPKPD